ncbi:MAG: amidohydrolase family protein [Acidimicrobiales bacterium]
MATNTTRHTRASEMTDLDEQPPLMVFSADTHVGPRAEDLRPYCPHKYLEAFDQFAAQFVALYKEMFESRGFSDEYWEGRRQNDRTAGHYDPRARLQDMDRDGVAGGVIFHDSLNGQPFPFDLTNSLGNGIPLPEARELAAVGRAMYNRWLADFCSVEPERNIGLAQLPFWDIDAAIKELEWCADHGLAGVNFPSPGQPGMPQPRDAELDRFFAACALLDMTLATHIGSLPPQEDYGDQGDERNFHFGLLDSGEWGIRTVYQLIIFGVFERHPNLKLVLTEVPGVFWNEICMKMDSLHHTPIRRKETKLLKLPSEYAATNVWMGNSFQSRQEAVAAIGIGKEDRFLWGSDYPHAEGTFFFSEDPDQYPRTRLALANTYHDLPIDKVRLLVGSNALNAYRRLDQAALNKVAQRVGVTVKEVSAAPDLSKYPYVQNTGTLAFRTQGPWN